MYPLRSAESGQALVELAVVLAFGSIALLLFLGVAEFGKVIYAAIEVSGAAKAGVQYGAQTGGTASDATGIQNAATAAAPDLAGLVATSSHACSCSDGTSSTCQSTDCPNSHIEETVTVNTTVTIVPPVVLRGLPNSYTLTGKATQQCTE
jgi:Flp pilus assembly protein TadG